MNIIEAQLSSLYRLWRYYQTKMPHAVNVFSYMYTVSSLDNFIISMRTVTVIGEVENLYADLICGSTAIIRQIY
jgi:hypothetical protein